MVEERMEERPTVVSLHDTIYRLYVRAPRPTGMVLVDEATQGELRMPLLGLSN